MYPGSKPGLSVSEKMNLVVKLAIIVPLRLLCQVVHNNFFAIWHRLPVKLYVTCAVVKVLLASFTARQIQYLSPPARQVYEAWLEKKMNRSSNHTIRRNLIKSITPLPVGGDSAILWLGDRHAARKVVLFFPGGGYVAGLMACHIELCWNAYVCTGMKENVEVAVAVLQYTLSPTGQYPVHLCQAASALSKLFEAGFRLRDIIIGGESAGGNLTMQLLGHLLHPHPHAQHIKLEEPLAGVFLVSPWLSSDVSSRFFRDNGKIDMLSAGIVQKISVEALGVGGLESCAAGENPWVAPLDVDESWLKGLDNIVKTMYITVGKREVLADHGTGLVRVVNNMNTGIDVRLEEMDEEAHDFLVLEGWLEQVGDATVRMQDWFKYILSIDK